MNGGIVLWMKFVHQHFRFLEKSRHYRDLRTFGRGQIKSLVMLHFVEARINLNLFA